MQNQKLIPIHVGLLGHIDAGKTAIARSLSEIISTAGLDKHPQSKKRGITIDIGFTFFPLENYMITLVDAPGHANLIKNVFSSVNIIDIALLIIDAAEGPQVQTGEHLIILDLLKISRIIVVINKIDLITARELEILKNKIKILLESTRFKNSHEIHEVSAKNNIGFDGLKIKLYDNIKQLSIQRDINSTLKFLIDHHFKKKGFGTILTGTVLSGKVSIGEKITILPINIECKVRSIQKSMISTDKIEAGDRCGIAVNIGESSQIYRGCFATNDVSYYSLSSIFEVEIKENVLFTKDCNFGQSVNVNLGMMSLMGRIFPYYNSEFNEQNIKVAYSLKSLKKKKYKAILMLEKPYYINAKDIFLLSRLDLSPKSLRIMGIACIKEIIKAPIHLYKEKIKVGFIKNPNYSNSSMIVEGLSKSRIGAQSIIGQILENPFGEIISVFGQKGNVEVSYSKELNAHIEIGEKVYLKLYKRINIEYSRSYDKIIN